MEVADSSAQDSSDNPNTVAGAKSEVDVLLHGDFVGFAYEGAGADDAGECVGVDLNFGERTSVDDDVVCADVEVCLETVAATLGEEFDLVGYRPFDLTQISDTPSYWTRLSIQLQQHRLQ